MLVDSFSYVNSLTKLCCTHHNADYNTFDDGDGVDQRRRRNRHVNDEIKSQKTMSSTALVTRLMALQSSLTYSISSKMRRCNDGVNQGLLHGRSSHEGNLYSRV